MVGRLTRLTLAGLWMDVVDGWTSNTSRSVDGYG